MFNLLIHWLLISLTFVAIVACSGKEEKMTSQKCIIDGTEMIVGPTSIEQIYFDFPDWQKYRVEYKPDSITIEKLKSLKVSFKVDIVLGTWCSDSRREVPGFYKVIEEASFKDIAEINLFAVSRSFRDSSRVAIESGVDRVATFIFTRENEEIGRIIETPDFSLEEDLLAILTKN